ncbi:MAG: leucine--tRNA ligase [Methanobacteriota archaeon]|nr:MAG: leucine--tRNA ligase [Euryarchaeota archaeon]
MQSYESNPDERSKFFITAAFPYPNSPQHIGHARTYSMADIYARYMRHRGKNVLFPMAFHVTGTPIIAMAGKIKDGDKDTIDVLTNIYGVPKEKLEELTEPRALVLYFAKEIEEGMKEMHFSIDWRRKFYTFDEHFQKFITWQFLKLKEKGYIVKGSHPVAWSLKLNSAVGAHDTKGDVDPEIEEVTAIKFPYGDGYLLATTYRPETVFGITNMWVKPEAAYIKVKDKESGELYYISEGTLSNFSAQRDVEIVGKLSGKDLVGKMAKIPVEDREVPIYEASFVDENEGTGIVMSVPAHAPFDYVALRDLGKEEVIKIIELEGYDIPAKDIVEKMDIENQQDSKLEQATKKLYKEENMKGKMLVWKPGMPVSKAKEEVKKWLIEEGNAFSYYVIANGPVITRAGDKVVVKLVKDQWFIDYGNKGWKELAYKCIDGIRTIPESVKQELRNTVTWLERKACTRTRGLGTPFPFDKKQVIESLSDSTIYPAFYTIAHKIREFSAEELDEAFFDYVFYGKGEARNDLHKELREEFLYWYPVDSRHSGPDLIRNHLTFYIMNHVAIFPEEHWPKQIAVNGFVMMEGKKMSKSMGNILPLRDAIRKYGADTIRFNVVSGADLLQDSDFNRTSVEGIKQRMAYFSSIIEKSKEQGSGIAERWVNSLLNKRLELLDSYIDGLNFRELAKQFFYDFYNELKWYESIVEEPAIKDTMANWLVVMEPFFPEFASSQGVAMEEELPEKTNYDDSLVASMAVVRELYADIIKVLQRTDKKAGSIKLFIPAQWKYKAFEMLKENPKNIKALYDKEGIAEHKEELAAIIKRLKGKIYSIPELPTRELFKECLAVSMPNFSKLANISIVEEEESSEEKAKAGLPLKPAFIVE